MNTLDRFWTKVDVQGPDDCWPWLAFVDGNGYGQFGVAGRYRMRAHRFAYEHKVGRIPEGLVIDHLCRNRRCVNPSHLEPVTNAENVRRGLWTQVTHCPRGHPYAGDNLYIGSDGGRNCKTCRRVWDRQRKEASKARRLVRNYRILRRRGFSPEDARRHMHIRIDHLPVAPKEMSHG